MQGLLYFFIIVLANAAGAISGMGGGVIVKPVLDFLGYDSVAAISFYSSVAVFTMSLVSTIRHIQDGWRFEWRQLGSLALGSVIGGFMGNQVFEWLLVAVSNEALVTLVQISLTIGVMVFAGAYTQWQWPSLKVAESYGYPLVGVVLGFLASLLGIGGGPINVALLMWCFALPIKQAAVYSICTIFCSQLMKITTIISLSGLGRYNIGLLGYIVAAGVVGGLTGAYLSNHMSENQVKRLFQWMVLAVIALNIYNGWRLWA